MNICEQQTHFSVGGISLLAAKRGSSELWVDACGSRTWTDLAEGIDRVRLDCLESGVELGSVVVIPSSEEFDDLIWLFGAAACGAIVAPLRPERAGESANWKHWFDVKWRVEAGRLVRAGGGETSPAAAHLFERLRSTGNPGLILATGGTTGNPKLVLHDLAALLASVPVKFGATMRVLPLMRFDHIGGLDMVWRALAGGHVIVAPPPEITPDAVAATVARHRVEVMPATPSFLNLLLVAGVHRIHDLKTLRTVPYGAEPMPESLLLRLRAILPHVDFLQRFGTSETGSIPLRRSASGLSLDEGSKGYAWKIVDGELWVRSPARALGYLTGEIGGFAAEGWFRTGDVAEYLPDATISVRGRRQDVINMGGEKILPSEVEGLLLSHPKVEDCRVFAAPNVLLGEVVAAEIVWTGVERSSVAVKQALRDHLSSVEARRKLPAVVRLVDAIKCTGNRKKERIAVR
jgi:acyl-CoA synthetase (AMP-forming)/AMP-acid ligase II